MTQPASHTPRPNQVGFVGEPTADVAGRIASHMIQSAGSYGRRAGATMFLWLLATRDTPPQSDF
ncbi:hypothetical protein ACFQ3B_08955 [Stackebrandtia endophytica]|uniref:hypothetical protein n=1 Tax=Stackebrandtia endophytica TaxID=1496996 RepID=UPI0011532D5C|nr:hypothetical protein [Stackebrandtia endophytica]